jgi:hypothetical protein
MGTPAQPGTPAYLVQSLTANNPMANISMNKATAFNVYRTALGLGYTSMVVQQTNATTSGDGVFTFPVLAAMGVSGDAAICCLGITPSAPQGENIAQAIQLIAGFDGMNSYFKLYAIEHPGTTNAQALGDLVNQPVIGGPLIQQLDALKTSNGLI